MAERELSLDLKKLLVNNEPFTYAHLVKYERPSAALKNGTFSTDAKRYAYYTDAGHNIDFNDGSLDTDGNANGTQTYVANKILNVGTYSETIEAKASGMTIKLAAESLHNSVTSNAITMNSTSITVPSHIDLVDEGFREGDKVLITGGSNNNQEVRVTGIKTNNTVLVVENIDSTLGNQSSGTSITLKIVSEELKGPLQQIGHTESLKAYHNREVFVYKAFLDPDTSAIKGAPVLIFKGIIQGTSLTENPTGQLTVDWSLTSHWGDFAQVKGRISNDKIHRAVDALNRGQPEAALKPEYANDLGFMHSEQTTNILATYTAIEQEMRIKVKKKWGGLKTKVKTWMEDVEVQREVNLDFSLNAHFIPVIYGIDRVQGKPIFVDTKSNDPNNIYIAYSLCEGQIGGLYDLYIDGNPLVCINKEDSDDRNDSTGASKENVQVFCRGRQDLGQTLGGVKISGTGVSGSTRQTYAPKRSMVGYGETGYEPMEDAIEINNIEYYTTNNTLPTVTATDSNGGGVLHEETITLSEPNTMRLTLHTGKSDQKANDTLTSIAVSPKFKRQQDYFDASDSGAEYWSPNHRLLDTAYVVLDCEIAEDATTVPEIEYVVRGKLLDCYNYDYSYDHAGTGGQSHTNFNVGDQVTLKKTSDDSTLNANVTIIDKWSFADAEGNLRYRFRYSTPPNLNYSDGIPGITAFYHTDGSNNWNMVTYNHIIESGTVPATLSVNTTVTATDGQALTANTGSNPGWLTSDEPFFPGGIFNFFFFADTNLSYFGKGIPFTLGGTTLTATNTNAVGATAGTQTLVAADKIKLASSANNSTDGFYNDYKIELTKTVTINGVKSAQKVVRTIGDYQAAQRVATVTETWPEGMAPDPDDVVQEAGAVYTYRLLPKTSTDDKRISINPAIQLLDYMTAPTYGKGLDIDKDIALSDFLLSARTCDDRGTQTLVRSSGSAPTVGDRYVLTSNGTTGGSVVAMGMVKSNGQFSDTNSNDYVVMEECFGKFSKRFMKNSHSYSVGDIVYGPAGGYYRVTTAGSKSTAPTGTNPTGFTGPLTSIPLYKISGGTISSTTFSVGLNTDFGYQNYVTEYNSTTKGYDTGYSIYDADNIKYWRYLGWDSPHQRNVTRHQTVGTVDTSKSVFENINGFLLNFNGLLSYEAGEYALRVETTSTAITSQIANSGDTGYTVGAEMNARYITEADVIGTLNIKDEGPKKAFNTIQASIEDPGNQFKPTAVSFYDSNYLKADKNVIKSGNMSQPAVSNYFNARINAENYLRKSRFGMNVSFKIGPKALLLLPGETIALDYPKFWSTPKKFRVANINFNKDCTASITATEYDDSFYTITAPTLSSVSGNDQRQGLQAAPGNPGTPTATAGAIGTIELSWSNNSNFTDNMFTEVWVNTSSSTSGRTLLQRGSKSEVFTHAVGEDNATRYYWIRHGKRVVLNSGGQNKSKVLFSDFVTGDPVTNATTTIPASFYGVTLSSNFGAFKFSADGNTQTPTSITITADKQNLTGTSTTFTATNSSGASVTLTGSGNTRALSNTNFGTTDYVTVTVTVTTTSAERSAGANNTYTDTVTIQKIQDGLVGSNGANAKTVKLTADDYSIVYNAAGASPSPSSSITLTATAQGFTNPYFKFTGDGISDESSFTDGASSTNDTFTFSVPSSHFTTPKSLRVGVSEADQTEVAFDTISLFAVKPGQQGTDGAEPVTKEFAVTVSGGKFVINGVSQKELTLLRGFTYKFDQSASTNSNHPIRFSTTSNGTHGGGSAYTSGVTHTGTPGSSGAFTTFKVPSDAPSTLYYYCANHSGMGGEINTQDLGSGITVICTNESHAVPADNGGGNPVMTGSGTSFEVFRGNTQLTGITSGTPGADQFKVTVTSDTNITVGSQSASSQAIVFADHSSMTATTANIVYSINVENTQTFTKKQSFSRADKGNTGSAGLKIKELELYYTLDFTGSSTSFSAITSGPSTGTYTFNNDTIASIPSGWTRTKPQVGAGFFTYISTALATESSSGSNTSGSLSWSTPGSYFNGVNVQNFIFKRATSAETPSQTDYPAIPSGWYDDIANVPSGSNPIWTSAGTGGTPSLSSGSWTAKTTWQKSTQLEGTDGTSVTVSGTSTDGNGNTVVTFSDGSTATISKGSDGQTQGVKVAYASDANGSNKSFTQGSLTFVKYVEYTGTAPAITNSVFNSGYVQFIGGDGTSEGVKPIYANNSSGSGASFTQGSRTFVNFYEWTGTEPTSIPSGLTYVKYIGDDGADGAASQTVFYRKSGASRWTPPSAPSGNITATSIANQWGTDFVAPDASNVVWQSIGNKPSGGSFSWGAPTIFFDKDRIVDLFEDNYSWDFSATDLGFLGLTNNDYLNSQVQLPTSTTGSGAPTSTPPNGSTYFDSTNKESYLRTGSTWTKQTFNYDDLGGLPTLFGGGWGDLTGTVPSTVLNSNVSLTSLGYTGATDANNYTLPADVITGASLSGQTLTLTKNSGGTVALTNTDTNTTYTSLSQVNSTEGSKLGGIATGATNNGSTLDSSGDIVADISMGSKMTFDVSADHLIISD